MDAAALACTPEVAHIVSHPTDAAGTDAAQVAADLRQDAAARADGPARFVSHHGGAAGMSAA